ncbi:hypothetical protein H2509_12685 [Stappia sp. F7233]|uniref:DUF3313 domain-containing protein n=1 Tax=Stappia albiluteola TaxID=2758565 RepID=A0A839ADW5_9HYPH|nr:hypothetical protein [Stappia albiluteola]MBA5777980.1 hypothetical protein [Stappia albiluteola]
MALLTACQHELNTDTAYRIDRVVVEPVPHSYGPIIKARLKSRFQAVADDINRQIPATAESRDLIVRVESVDYVPPTGPLLLGKGELEGQIVVQSSHASQTLEFGARNRRQSGLGDYLNLSGYYRAGASFDRLATELAYKFSRRYAAEHGTTPIRRDDLAHSPRPATAPSIASEVPPPPLVVLGGV